MIELGMGSGWGSMYVLVCYWSRIKAWSEITAMIVAACVTFILSRISFAGNNAVVFAKTALITAGCTTIAWILATFLTHAESDEKLVAFYRRVHPTVYGWRRIAALAPELHPVRDLRSNT